MGGTARGSITEASGKVKTGKTTFILKIAHSVVTGTPFLGKDVPQGVVIFLTEEGTATIKQATRRAGFSADDDGLHVMFRNDVGSNSLPWTKLASAVVEEVNETNASLVIVDTISNFTRVDDENDASQASRAMDELRTIAMTGAAVIYSRHDRKGGGDLGDSGRGSSAYSGYADILLQFGRANQEGHPTRRLLTAIGRFDETPDEMIVELKAGQYVPLGSTGELERASARNLLLDLFPSPDANRLTEKDILGEDESLSRSTFNRAFRDLESEGLADREKGYGEKKTAYGYALTPEGTEAIEGVIIHTAHKGIDPEQLVSDQPTTIENPSPSEVVSPTSGIHSVQPPSLNGQFES